MKPKIYTAVAIKEGNTFVTGQLLIINDDAYIYPNDYGDVTDIDFGYSFIEVFKDSIQEVESNKMKTKEEIEDKIKELKDLHNTWSNTHNQPLAHVYSCQCEILEWVLEDSEE